MKQTILYIWIIFFQMSLQYILMSLLFISLFYISQNMNLKIILGLYWGDL